MAERNSIEIQYVYKIRCIFASNTHAIFDISIYRIVERIIDINKLTCIYEENMIFKKGERGILEMVSNTLGYDTIVVPNRIITEARNKAEEKAKFVLGM